MDKTYFIELVEYNLLATNIVCSWLEKISEEQWNAPVQSSFGSIRETTLHIISSTNAWLERMNKKENVVRLECNGTKQEHIILWKNVCEQFKNFVVALDEAKLYEELAYKRFTGIADTVKYYRIITHVVNHASYHRGQQVTLLRQVGFTDMQPTDFDIVLKQTYE
jgi:uncharacterized damage-inducible protein DinB